MPRRTMREAECLIEESEFESSLKFHGGSFNSKLTYRSIRGGGTQIKFVEQWLVHLKAKEC